MMTHAEFVKRLALPGFRWGVGAVVPVMIHAWGREGRRAVWLIAGFLATLVLLPVIAAGASGRAELLPWFAPIAVAVIVGRPGLTCLGLGPWFGFMALGLLLMVVRHTSLHLVVSAVPLVGWLASAAIRAVVMARVEEKLRVDPALYQRLLDDHLLLVVDPPPAGHRNPL